MAAVTFSFSSPTILVPCFRRAALVLFFFAAGSLFAAKWPAVDPQELADTKPQVDPEAGAEVLLRETTIDQSVPGELAIRYYVRAKIYSERGIEEFAKVELPYDNELKIRDVAVRTIKPDGQIVELTKKDVYDREVIKSGKLRVKVKSFAPAGLQTGAIVEYSYSEISERWSWIVPMFFQNALPARVVRFYFRPVDGQYLSVGLHINALFFNCAQQSMKLNQDGYYPFELRNVAAVKEEAWQPPQLNCQSSILICYSTDKLLTPDKYWRQQSKELLERFEKECRVTKQLRAAVATIVAESDSEEVKLRKIYDHCRTKVVNYQRDTVRLTNAQRAKLKSSETATDTLKAGTGSSEEINLLFAALARAAGCNVQLVACNDRSFLQFNHQLTEPFLFSDLAVAVQREAGLSYFDPGATYLPFATLHWQNSETARLLSVTDKWPIVPVAGSKAEESQRKRTATLSLDADGTLEGDVSIDFTGMYEVEMKNTLDAMTPSEREVFVRDLVQEHLKLAELTEIKVENADAPLEPLKMSFHLRVPEYADRTGTRLFFQPAVFQKNVPRTFTAATRVTDLIFSYACINSDLIRIALPEGFSLEAAAAPGSFNIGELGNYATAISVRKKGTEIVYERTFTRRGLNIPAKFYKAVQSAYDMIHERDAHTLTLKHGDAAKPSAATPTTSPPASATASVKTEATNPP